MTQPSILRLNALRGGYLLLVIGLGLTIWPAILDPAQSFTPQRGIVICMLGSMSALAVLGLQYPLGMLPLLFFEIGWKAIWLTRIALPLWRADRLDAAATEMVFECSVAAIIVAVVPWPYVWNNYLAKPADPWRRRAPRQASAETA